MKHLLIAFTLVLFSLNARAQTVNGDTVDFGNGMLVKATLRENTCCGFKDYLILENYHYKTDEFSVFAPKNSRISTYGTTLYFEDSSNREKVRTEYFVDGSAIEAKFRFALGKGMTLKKATFREVVNLLIPGLNKTIPVLEIGLDPNEGYINFYTAASSGDYGCEVISFYGKNVCALDVWFNKRSNGSLYISGMNPMENIEVINTSGVLVQVCRFFGGNFNEEGQLTSQSIPVGAKCPY